MPKTKEDLLKLTIYMKSGNAILIDGVTKYHIERDGRGCCKLELEQWIRGPFRVLELASLDVGQIEAITYEHYERVINKGKEKKDS